MIKLKSNEKLVSVAEYAYMCEGLTLQAIYKRVKSGTLKFAKRDPVALIDINKYPPIKLKLGRIPYISSNRA